MNASDSPNFLAMARQVQKAREQFSAVTSQSLFHDSAWDMMLEVFVARQEGKPLFVKELSIISGDTPTTALRRIQELEEANLLVRRPDTCDHRRVMVELTDQGNEAMTTMLINLYGQKG